MGRYVVATRDLKAGEVIIEEPPVTVGPKQFTPVVCLGCSIPIEIVRVCSGCGWPMCSEECAKNSALHQLECKHLANCKFKPKPDQQVGHDIQMNKRNIFHFFKYFF